MSTNFHIQRQQAHIINQADRIDIDGGQHVSTPPLLSGATRALRAAVLQTPMTERARAEAIGHVDRIENALEQPKPDQQTVGQRLGDLAAVLAAAGAFTSGGASLLNSITAIAALVGRFGHRALGIIRAATSA